MAIVTITESNFQTEVLDATLPVLLDFWASWCGPCRMLSPVVDRIAEEYEGKVKVGKVNVDEEMTLAMRFQVGSIPTLLVFKDGKVVNQSVGVIPKEKIEALIK